MHKYFNRGWWFAGLALVSLPGQLRAEAVLAAPERPAWLAELSGGVKESYDSSVFLSSVDPKYYAITGYKVPVGSVAALRDQGSALTTVSARAGVNLLPWLGQPAGLTSLSLGYAPEVVRYHAVPAENYETHRLTTTVKGVTGPASYALDHTLTYINGSEFGPTYPGGFVTAYNAAVPRERRQQLQDRATVSGQYDLDRWFLRPGASLLYYNLMTAQINATGYQNYESRYDVNGGADTGYKITPQKALTLGYRYGRQYQQQFAFSPDSSSGDYQRVLAGFEGKPWQGWEVKISGGPEFHRYDADTATHITPVRDLNLLTYYGEACVTATLTPADVITLKYKQWQWVSSVGKVPYFDSTYDVNYHRKLAEKLGADVGFRYLESDYHSGNLSTCQRDDAQFSVTAGLGCAVNRHLNLTLAYELDLGRNQQDALTNPATRDYDRHLVSLAALVKF